MLSFQGMENFSDDFFMREALKEAKKALAKDEVPVGAVLVYENRIIAKGFNQVEMLKDATAHAEMICLSAGSENMGDWRLTDATLYTTLEPCCMCAGAVLAARIKRLVWGAPDVRLGVNGSWIDVFEKKHPMHSVEITTHVLADESRDLLQGFFAKKREKKCSMS